METGVRWKGQGCQLTASLASPGVLLLVKQRYIPWPNRLEKLLKCDILFYDLGIHENGTFFLPLSGVYICVELGVQGE